MQLIAVTQSFQSQDYKHTSLKSNPISIQPRLGDLKNSKTLATNINAADL